MAKPRTPPRTSGYYVDASCFTSEALLKVVMLEPWEPDPRWIPHRDYGESLYVPLRVHVEVDVPFGSYHIGNWIDLGWLVMVVESYPIYGASGRERTEYNAEVYIDRLATAGISARLVWEDLAEVPLAVG